MTTAIETTNTDTTGVEADAQALQDAVSTPAAEDLAAATVSGPEKVVPVPKVVSLASPVAAAPVAEPLQLGC